MLHSTPCHHAAPQVCSTSIWLTWLFQFTLLSCLCLQGQAEGWQQAEHLPGWPPLEAALPGARAPPQLQTGCSSTTPYPRCSPGFLVLPSALHPVLILIHHGLAGSGRGRRIPPLVFMLACSRHEPPAGSRRGAVHLRTLPESVPTMSMRGAASDACGEACWLTGRVAAGAAGAPAEHLSARLNSRETRSSVHTLPSLASWAASAGPAGAVTEGAAVGRA